MRDIDTRDLLNSINYTLREDSNSSLFNTTMSDKNINSYLYSQLNINNIDSELNYLELSTLQSESFQESVYYEGKTRKLHIKN
jgi:hypothetical protein